MLNINQPLKVTGKSKLICLFASIVFSLSISITLFAGTLYAAEFIIDNNDSECSFVRRWTTSNDLPGYNGTDYRWHRKGKGRSSATWTPVLAAVGNYEVYGRWVSSPSNATDAKYTINHTAGSNVAQVDQTINGGQWVSLGTYVFDASGTGNVVLRDNANGDVIADAIRFVEIPTVNNPPVWNPVPLGNATEDQEMNYDVSGYASDPDGDSLTFSKISGSAWISVSSAGVLTGTPSASDIGTASVTVSAADPFLESSETVISVEVFAKPVVPPVNNPPAWNPVPLGNATEDQEMNYDVSAYASDPDGDSLTFSKVSGAAWISVSSAGVLIGTPGSGDIGTASVTVSAADPFLESSETVISVEVFPKPVLPPGEMIIDNSDPECSFGKSWVIDNAFPGYYGADYRRHSKVEGQCSAVWTPAITEAGEYEVFTRWVNSSRNATNAEYTINHTAGSDTLLIDQKINGGQWVSIGTYAFDTSGAGNIVLSDNANGNVIADAVRLVEVNHPPVISAINNVKTGEGETAIGNVDATDIDGDLLVFSLIDAPGFVSLVDNGDNSAVITIAPLAGDKGIYSSVKVRAFDGSKEAIASFDIEVLDESVGKALDFLYGQMDLYASGSELRLLESYVPTATFNDGQTARVYGNALSVRAFLARGYEEDIARAKVICDSLVWVQNNDPTFADGRIRDEYWSTSISGLGGKASVKSPGTGLGNISWAVIALLQYYQVDSSDTSILASAIQMGNFIELEYKDANPGFVNGYIGWEPGQEKTTFKSTEQNATVYAAFSLLYKTTGDLRWKQDALWAKDFLKQTAWNSADGYFYSGTMLDGVTPNTYNPALDPNTISLLGLGSLGVFDRSIGWVEAEYALVADGFAGFDFNRDLDGVWFKGTAQMTLAYQASGDAGAADFYLSEMKRVQSEGLNADGNGIISASHDGVTTGYSYSYYASLHIATTAWYVLSELGAHPFYLADITGFIPHFEATIQGSFQFESRTNHSKELTLYLKNGLTGDLIEAYQPLQDGDSSKAGIQIFPDQSGAFSLYELPVEDFDTSLLIHSPGFLRKSVELILEEWAEPVSVSFGELKAGDINEDNIVNQKDLDIIDNLLGRTEADQGFDFRADFNGDGIIDTVDRDWIVNNMGFVGDGGVMDAGPSIMLYSPLEEDSISLASPVEVMLTGSVDDPDAIVTINGVVVSLNNGEFSHLVTLDRGNSIITITAENLAGIVTTLEREVEFYDNPLTVWLDTFEEGNSSIESWFNLDGTIVYKWYDKEDKDITFEGKTFKQIEYKKIPGYEDSFIGATPLQDGIINDFSKYDEIGFWMKSPGSGLAVRMRLEDVHGGIWYKDVETALINQWEKLSYSFQNTAIVDFSNISNIVILIEPGQSGLEGEVALDGLYLTTNRNLIPESLDEPLVISIDDIAGDYADYDLRWDDLSANGASYYEIEESDAPDFIDATVYLTNNNFMGIRANYQPGDYYYRVRYWNRLEGEYSPWSNVIVKTIVDGPPIIEQVDSFTSSGDNDEIYETGTLVKINATEKYNAPDIIGGTIRITSALQGYDSGTQPLSFEADHEYWFYHWETRDLLPSNDYTVAVTLEDNAGQVDSDGSDMEPDLVVELTSATAPLIAKLYQRTDFTFPARMIPFKFERTYNYRKLTEKPLGFGWTHSYNIYVVELHDGRVDYVMGDGSEISFASNGDGTYKAPKGVRIELVKEADDTFTMRYQNGNVYAFDSGGKLVSAKDRNNNMMSFTYAQINGESFLDQVIAPGGEVIDLDYVQFYKIEGTNGEDTVRLSQVTDPSGRIYQYSYDPAGKLTRYIDNAGIVTQYAYDPDGKMKMSMITYPNGLNQHFAYYDDEFDRLKSVINSQGVGDRHFSYESGQTIVKITDANGNIREEHYNGNGILAGSLDPHGNSTQLFWDSKDRLVQLIDPLSQTVAFEYDDQDNKTKMTRYKDGMIPVEINRTFEPIFNKVTSLTDELGRLVEYEYDAKGNSTRMIRHLGGGTIQETQYEYNSLGQLTRRINELGQETLVSYFDNGLIRNVTDNLGNISQFEYDIYGNKTKQIDANGKETLFNYDIRNQLTFVTEANGARTNFTYDISGNLTAISDAKGRIITYEHDLYDRTTKLIYPDGTLKTWAYDANSNVTGTYDQRETVLWYEYDALDRMTAKHYPDGNMINYSYDPLGRLISAIDQNGAMSFEYDLLGRATRSVNFTGDVVQYEYDDAGNRTKLIYPDGFVINYNYNARDQMTHIRDDFGNVLCEYEYDSLGRRTARKVGNNVARTQYSYDDLNRLSNLVNTTVSSGDTISQFNYSYDAVDNITQRIRDSVTDTFGYDDVYQLINYDDTLGASIGYTYDLIGNREDVDINGIIDSYASDIMNRYLNVGGMTLSYDNSGNLVNKSEGVSITNYNYDYDNRLLFADTTDRGNALYVYDAFNRLTRALYSWEANKVYVNDITDHVLIEKREDGTLINRYVYGANVDEVVCIYNNTVFHNWLYVMQDHQGNVTNLLTTWGTPLESYEYDPYGNFKIFNDETGHNEIAESRFDNPVMYTGRWWDEVSGIYYYRNRWHDTGLGRFLNHDPIGFLAGDLNLYRYVGNNPVNFVDPFGLKRKNPSPSDSTPPDPIPSETDQDWPIPGEPYDPSNPEGVPRDDPPWDPGPPILRPPLTIDDLRDRIRNLPPGPIVPTVPRGRGIRGDRGGDGPVTIARM